MTLTNSRIDDASRALSQVYTGEKKIRSLLTDISVCEAFTPNSRLWNQLVVALDTVGDTSESIRAYLHEYPANASSGLKYLMAYGLLQALFLQQDAVRDIGAALGLPPEHPVDPALHQIRELRNDSIGHPTCRGRKKDLSFHAIARMTLSQEGFEILSRSADDIIGVTGINVVDLITTQTPIIGERLTRLADEVARQAGIQHPKSD